MKCLRCNGEMEHLGHESLQLGQYGFFTGHLSNLFSGALEVDIYACKSCGKLEFYRADAQPQGLYPAAHGRGRTQPVRAAEKRMKQTQLEDR